MDDMGWLFATRTSSNAEKATARGAWTAIAKKLPHRRVKAVWAAGTRMLHEGNFQVGAVCCGCSILSFSYGSIPCLQHAWGRAAANFGIPHVFLRQSFAYLACSTASRQSACLQGNESHARCMQGRWTAEEEAKLLELAAQKPGRWAEIGTALGRLPEGARDKHRLLTGIAGGARKGRWDAAEEARLVDLVEAFLADRQVVRWHMSAP